MRSIVVIRIVSSMNKVEVKETDSEMLKKTNLNGKRQIIMNLDKEENISTNNFIRKITKLFYWEYSIRKR